MKVLIYIPASDAKQGKVDPSNYHNVRPQPGYNNYVQVSITPDEYARLGDTIVSSTNSNELEERIYKESQKITGREFEKWYKGLSQEEQKAYKAIYGN